MRSASLLLALAAMAVAAPRPNPQDFDIDAVEALPDPTGALGPDPTATAEILTYSSAAVIASIISAVATDPAAVVVAAAPTGVSLVKRDCDTQPDGYGPTTTPDTAEDFLANPIYQQMASAAAQTPPKGYSLVFANQPGSLQQIGYAGFKQDLKSYDLNYCANQCDVWVDKCVAFNIYIERDPSLAPGPNCLKPASIVNFKCSFYGYPIDAVSAVNTGQPREGFTVAVTASNGYQKNVVAPSLTNFTLAGQYNNAAINAPSSYIGVKVFVPDRYDPSVCATACQANTAYNKASAIRTKAATYHPCNYFNSYVLIKNGVPTGVTCSLYSQPWDATYAVNKGQTRGTDKYTVGESLGYSLTVQDSGVTPTS